jgi:ubiquinone/menaquinone biosynthesis C-methylase UbiE
MRREATATDYLQRWHDRHPGATTMSLGSLADQMGRSSYEVLAGAIQHGGEPVLDLACGDGHLLELLGPKVPCLGSDWNAAELHAASERLGREARIVRADATELPISTASLGTVGCHYALMLLQPLERVISELARVLRPSGLFAAALPASPPADTPDPVSAFRAAWQEVSAIYPVVIPPVQDDRALEPENLSVVLMQAGFTSVSIEPFSGSKKMTIDEAVQCLLLTYLPDLLPAAGFAHLKHALEIRLAELAESTGSVTFVLYSHLVTARRL